MASFELYHGDCLKVMPTLTDNVDAIITDPPYGTTACKWDSVIPFEPMWENLKRLIKSNGAIALFGSEPFSSTLRMSNIEQYKYDWVWDKVKPSGHLNAAKRPMTYAENVMLFNVHHRFYNPIKVPQKKRVSSSPKKHSDVYGEQRHVSKQVDEKYPSQIIRISNALQSGKLHPTQKPVALMEYLIKTYTNEGGMVLDFTMGSGSTGVAAMNTGRNFIGIEQDAEYFEIAKQRIEKAKVAHRQPELL